MFRYLGRVHQVVYRYILYNDVYVYVYIQTYTDTVWYFNGIERGMSLEAVSRYQGLMHFNQVHQEVSNPFFGNLLGTISLYQVLFTYFNRQYLAPSY